MLAQKRTKMTEKKRTPKETAKVVAKTIADIRKVLDAVPVMTGYSFFDAKCFKATGFDALVEKVCRQMIIVKNIFARLQDLTKKNRCPS